MKHRAKYAALFLSLAVALCLPAAAVEPQTIAPSGLCTTAEGGLMIADLYHRAVWQRAADGSLVRLAGQDGARDENGDPIGGYNDDAALSAAFQTPWAIVPFVDGYAITDTENNVVRYFADGKVSTLAGTGAAGLADGTGIRAAFDGPTGLAADASGALYVADTGNSAIRKIDTRGNVTTYLTRQAGLNEPTGLYFAGGVLYVADSGNNRICKIENGSVVTLAGLSGDEGDGLRDGAAAQALFSHPQGLLVQEDSIFIADTGNGAVRLLKGGLVSTLIQTGQGEGGLYPVAPRALAFADGRLYVGDVFSRHLFTLNPALVAAPRFSDVPDGAWYADAVSAVSASGLMRGVDETHFAPNEPMDRAMCAVLLANLDAAAHPDSARPTNGKGFSDVPSGSYFAQAVGWAAQQGYVQGADGLFEPYKPATRAEFAVFLWRYAGSPASAASLDAFSDQAAVPVWAADALRYGIESGLIKSMDDGRLCPLQPLTRAEAATLLSRYQMKTP